MFKKKPKDTATVDKTKKEKSPKKVEKKAKAQASPTVLNDNLDAKEEKKYEIESPEINASTEENIAQDSDFSVQEFNSKKKKRTIIILVTAIVLLIGLAIADYMYIKAREREEKQYLSVVEELSEENIVQEASEEMIPMYNFLLYGKHQSAVQSATDGIAYFTFNPDGSYEGYSAASETDTGTYEISVQNAEYLLTILCDSGMTSTYIVDFTDTKDIRLSGIDKTKGTYILFN